MQTRRAVLTILFQSACALARAQTSSERQRPAYRAVRVDGVATLKGLQETYGADGFETILHLNRIDRAHVRDGATLVVPDTLISRGFEPPRFVTSLNDLSPFPLSLGATAPASERLLVVSRRVQAFAAYEKGALVRWGAVSTGRRETPTPEGLFATNWRSKLRRSSDNPAWLLPWYVNFVNESGVSFHQFELPGRPASHACVRLMEADAKWIYEWAEAWVLADGNVRIAVHGTPVVVYGEFDFGAPGPWTRLPVNAGATTIALDELSRALAPHRVVIGERAAARAAWIAQRQ